jgi:CBS domain-containing protein
VTTETRVRDWMHAGVVTCRPDTPVAEVARTMRARHISALVVTDGDGLAVGVISRTDLANVSFVEAYLAHWRGMEARHLMTSPVVSVRPETPVAQAIVILRERRIHRLVVTEPAVLGERPVGVLSMTDVVARMEVPSHA